METGSLEAGIIENRRATLRRVISQKDAPALTDSFAEATQRYETEVRTAFGP